MAILEGYEKQRRYIARDNGDHQLISEWTNANTVEFDDLETLPTKIDKINDDIDTINTELNKKLNLSGGAMTGVLKAQSGKTSDAYDGALDMNNSNIFNLNSIYTADPSNSAAEGIHFRRDDTHVDTLWMANGNLMFVPNRELGTGTTVANSQKVGRFSTNPTSGQLVVANGTNGEIKTSGFTISTSVPANAKFTDANVTQTNTTTNANYRLLFSATADNTTRTEGTRKSGDLTYNPSTKTFTANKVRITGDLWINAGFVVANGYGAISADQNYAYLGYRKERDGRTNDIRVYETYVGTGGKTDDKLIKLKNNGKIECDSLELITVEPHVDFHRNNSTADYTGRIINRDEGYLDFYKTNAAWATLRAASFNTQSSIHIKTNVADITDDEAKKLLELRPVSFDYINGDSNQRGLIAEEVMEILPNTVSIPDGYTGFNPNEPWNTPSIDYSKYVPYLIKMIQIQQQEIDELKRR